MKIRVKVMSILSIWWEEFDVDTDDAEQWAKDTVKNFNQTRRPGELRRTVLDVEVVDMYSIKKHKYEKTNLVTKADKTGMYDTVECSRCGVTARRYGIVDQQIVIDRKFKAQKFARCDTAMEALGITNKGKRR